MVLNTNNDEDSYAVGTDIEYRLTTIDNPYSPFKDFDKWFLFDAEKGYNTCGRVARIANTSDELTEQENTRVINEAIDEIIKYDFMNIYKKVTKDDPIIVDVEALSSMN